MEKEGREVRLHFLDRSWTRQGGPLFQKWQEISQDMMVGNLGYFFLELSLCSGIYWGDCAPPDFYFDVGRLKERIGVLGSWGLSALILLCIVGAMAITGSILVGSLRSLSRNLRIAAFPSRRKTHSLSREKSLGAGSLLSAVGLCLFLPCPLLAGASRKKMYSGLGQNVQWLRTTESEC